MHGRKKVFIIKIGLELYSLRGELQKDFLGTLEKVSVMGYDSVEFAGFGNTSAQEMKAALERLHLIPVAAHIGLELLENDLQNQIEYQLTIGGDFIVCPFATLPGRREVNELIRVLNQTAQQCHRSGLRFAYHNHAHEFQKLGGEYIMDILLRETDPELVLFEPDVCFLAMSGLDPAEYISKYAARCKLIHLKEYRAGYRNGMTELGTGEIDFARVIAAADRAGTEALIVEQEFFANNALDSVAQNRQYLKTMYQL